MLLIGAWKLIYLVVKLPHTPYHLFSVFASFSCPRITFSLADVQKIGTTADLIDYLKQKAIYTEEEATQLKKTWESIRVSDSDNVINLSDHRLFSGRPLDKTPTHGGGN